MTPCGALTITISITVRCHVTK